MEPNDMNHRLGSLFKLSTFSVALLISGLTGFAQISPGEITDPQLRVVEQSYLPKLIEINRAVETTKFPFLFSLSRYVGLDPKQQKGADKRGLEFVNFHGRVVLKTTGNYNAAYNASLLTPNQRTNKTLDEVIQPILSLMADRFSADDKFDAFGFEIGYHVRTKTSGIDYEGKENLVVVMDKADAFNYVVAKDDSDRQQILGRAEVFINGKPLGVQRGGLEPFSLEVVNRADLNQESTVPPAAAEQDVRKLQMKYQTQLDLLASEGAARFHFVEYAPPSLARFRDQVYLQVTLRNPEKFNKESTSIYKRAAESFDLLLAPQLKGIVDRLPRIAGVSGVGFSILNEVSSTSGPSSSEAVEFFLPMVAIDRFANTEITNQDLINQGVVLINGVRISLDLQRVE
jgi:hypothetical protein